MPYDSLDKLPENVKNVLPKQGQKIFKEAYNSAWDQYGDPKDRRGDQSREETAYKVAWSAVKGIYEKKDGKWQKK